jgi:hypothetical protein
LRPILTVRPQNPQISLSASYVIKRTGLGP